MKFNFEFKIFFIKLISIFLLIIFVISYTYNLFISDNIDLLKKISNISDRQSRNQIKDKIRKEIKESVEKDRILSKEDAELLKSFLNKISKELKSE
jgi:cell division protein FtsL